MTIKGDVLNRIICTGIAAVCAAASALVGECQGKILARWVELGADESASVRVVTEDACPAVVFDGAPIPMGTRSDPADKFDNVKPATFPVRGCEVAVPPGAISAVLDGRPLPLPRPNPQRIVVLGDTGCCLAGAAVQDCNNPQAWPFPTIAASAAAARSDRRWCQGGGSAQVKNSATYSGFGYMVWDRSGSRWAGTLFDTAGKPLQHCRLAGRSLACGA